MNKKPVKSQAQKHKESKDPYNKTKSSPLHSSTMAVQDQLKISSNKYLYELYDQSIRASTDLYKLQNASQSNSPNYQVVVTSKQSQKKISSSTIKQKIPFVPPRTPTKQKITMITKQNTKQTTKKTKNSKSQILNGYPLNQSCNDNAQKNLELSFSNDDNSFVMESADRDFNDKYVSPKFKQQSELSKSQLQKKTPERSFHKKQDYLSAVKSGNKEGKDKFHYKSTQMSPRPDIDFKKDSSSKINRTLKTPEKKLMTYSPISKTRQKDTAQRQKTQPPETEQDLTRQICFEREILINERLQSRLERIKELKLELLQLEYETYQIEAQRNQYFNKLYSQQIKQKE